VSVKRALDCGAINAFLGDEDECAIPLFIFRPRPIKLMTEACADPLHQEPHRFAGDIEKPFDAQDIELIRNLFQARDEGVNIGNFADGQSETVKIFVVMLFFMIMMGGP
jgi:hypothetical protein